ncbi:glutaredoxin family protein [Tomitella biformata]|uniref:glutaredoxin family protein n=1 Tax=Tomitella biformata TaxID=630403 RepID=UPI000570B32C|nr:glutaredoxin family protein [Tomitella biformata]
MGNRRAIMLLSRAGCSSCVDADASLLLLCKDFDVDYSVIDVDAAAGENPELRAEFGDRLPVVLLDGREHSYWEVDEDRLRADLAQ